MMETVLNIGLSDESVHGLAKQAGSERFAWDSYRRLIQMFGKTVLDIEGGDFEQAIDAGQAGQGHEERPRPRRRRPARHRRHLQGHRPQAHRP
jgi:pyruvate,orthophosphate dikinase